MIDPTSTPAPSSAEVPSTPTTSTTPPTPLSPILASSSPRGSFPWKPLLGVIFIAAVAFGGWKAYQLYRAKEASTYAYIIPGVPALNIYSEEMLNSVGYVPGKIAMLIAILRYWGETADINDLALRNELGATGPLDIDALRSTLEKRGYAVKIITAQDPHDLIAFLAQQNPVPLLAEQVVSPEAPGLTSTRLIIGIDFAKGVVVTNDYLRGQTYSIPLAEYQHLLDVNDSPNKYQYIAIYPTDQGRIAARVAKNAIAPAYEPRTAVMDELSPALPAYLRVTRTKTKQNIDNKKALGHLTQITGDPILSKFHPAIQSRLYAQQSRFETRLGLYPAALADANKAIEIDKNLNAPVAGWGQFHFAQIPDPYFSLSVYYKTTGDTKKADAALKEATAIASSSNVAILGDE